MWAHIITTQDFPDIQGDYGAPWMDSALKVTAWLLGTCTVLVFAALIVCIVVLVFGRAFPDGARRVAGSSIVGIAIAAACLGSASGIFQFMVGFDVGF